MSTNSKQTRNIAVVGVAVVGCYVAAWFYFLKKPAQLPVPVTAWSASGNHGLLRNVSLTEGVTRQAFLFAPNSFPWDTYTGVQIPDASTYELTNALSIVGWVRPRGDGYVIFFRGDHRPGLDPYCLSMQANHHLRFQICGQSNDDNTNVDAEIPYCVWTHVAATLDGSTGKMSLYTNGLLAVQITTTVRPMGPLLVDQSPGIGIGNVSDGGNNFPFVGEIDSIALYDRALSAAEVKASYAEHAASAGGKVELLSTR